ncbi:MAG: uroporphyrinogen decarboxylase family protein [Phycisphaeraceae bacterium]
MNLRQRLAHQMHYQPVDRSCLVDFNMWDETIPQWHTEGLPKKYTRRNIADYCGLDVSLGGGEKNDWGTGVQHDLCPGFPGKILEDDGDIYTQMQSDGVIVRCQRSSVSIPMHVGHTLVDRESWVKHYKPRLDPATAERFPGAEDWDRRVKIWTDPNREYPVFVNGGSLFGRLRDWMGIENIALVVYDDPAWFGEMVETVADLQVALLTKILNTGGKFDACQMWEDMCYNAGPLLSPTHFKQYLVPQYKRITSLLHKRGIDIVWIDCDGKIDDLLPLWLDAGVNCMFPIEVGTWNADPRKFRKQYGKDLLMMGGFDKHILARSKDAITKEIEKLTPLVEEGGFIPMPDHRVPPDVPLENYLHYCRTVRAIWGKGVNLPVMEAE